MNSWKEFMNTQKDASYMLLLNQMLKQERQKYVIHPQNKDVFRAFKLTPFNEVKVILMAQDPYIKPDQANGLAFSVPKGISLPPSIQNIYAELKANIGFKPPAHGDLEGWAKQGVLLINSIMTVRQGVSASHSGLGWEHFTDAVIRALSDHRAGLIFCLWGNFAKAKKHLIDENKHYVLQARHPVARDNSFLGCGHFSQINQILEQEDNGFIDWQNL
jgi:uracil-DNA glycosylase